MNNTDKDFLGFECNSQPAHEIDRLDRAVYVRCRSYLSYEYLLHFSLESNLKTSVAFTSENSTNRQGLTNCVKKSIELCRQKIMPFWFKRAMYENIKDRDAYVNKAKQELSQEVQALCYEEYLELPVNHAAKPDKLLELIGEQLATKGMMEHYVPTEEDCISCAIPIPSENYRWSEELIAILNNLEERRLIQQYAKILFTYSGNTKSANLQTQPSSTASGQDVSITIDGWAYLGTKTHVDSKKVFIAMDFSTWESQEDIVTREKVIEKIKEACRKAGNYEANIVSQNHTNYITDKILTEIKRSKFVIAEFTHQNKGAYYEAGFAKALGKNVYHLIHEDHQKDLHFDVRQILYRTWKDPEDIVDRLSDWIANTEHSS